MKNKEKKNLKNREKNRKYKTLIKKTLKEFETLKNEKRYEKMKEAVSRVQKYIDISSRKKIIHKNKANRIKSNIQKSFINSLQKTEK